MLFSVMTDYHFMDSLPIMATIFKILFIRIVNMKDDIRMMNLY